VPEANPHDYRAWYGIGQAYELLQQPVFALYYYRRASVLRYGLGAAPRRPIQTGRRLVAVILLDVECMGVGALRPYDARMWRALGSIYERLERWADAIFCYEQAHDGDGGTRAVPSHGWRRRWHGV